MSALPQPSHGEESTGYQETPSMILPAAVPPELDAAIDAAWQRANALAAAGRGLDFEIGPDGELAIGVTDPAGQKKPVSPSRAVNIMGGLHQV